MTEKSPGPTLDELAGLPAALSIAQAGALMGLGRSTTYRLLAEGRFPVPLLPLPGRRKVATAVVLELLGLLPIQLPATTRPNHETRAELEPIHKDSDETA